MQAAVLTEPGEFVLEERDRPTPADGEVLVRVREVGICGSDVHYYEHGHIGDKVVEEPLVLGHESAGEVAETGDAVDDLAVGDRVAIEPGVPCRRCARCARGEYHLCPDVHFMATPPNDGAFAEYVAWPADFAYRLPEDVSLAEGALCEPLSVGIHAARRGGVATGDAVCITGCGPIGLVAMETARAAGATEVIVADPVERKRTVARERGADLAVDPTETDLAAAVREHLEDGQTAATAGGGGDGSARAGADVVIEASGAEPAIRSTIDVARRGGTVVLVGLADEADVPFDVLDLVDAELDVRGSFRYSNTYRTAIDLLADGAVDVAGLIDYAASLEEITEAFERAREPGTIKGMIRL